MKQIKKITALLMAVLFSLSLLTACGGGKHSAASGEAYDGAYYEEPAMEAETDYDMEMGDSYAPDDKADEGASGESVYDRTDVKLIRTANVDIESTDFDAACAALEALVEKYGGYMENTEVYQGSYGATYRSADYTVRVPADKYSAFLGGVDSGEAFHVTRKNESTEDVGNDYADTEAHLKALRTKLDRLNALLAKAETMEDIITIESAITDTEARIEKYSSQLTRYDRLISYATIRVNIEQVRAISETIEDPFLRRVATSFTEGTRDFVEFLEDAVIWFAGNIFVLLLWVLLLFGFIRFCRWLGNRRPKMPKKMVKKADLQKKEEKNAEKTKE